MTRYDLAVIGGGVVGLAVAERFTRRFPEARLVLFDKEPSLARHQTGHNSGVIHSGIYYAPGSLKAVSCSRGRRALEEFCGEESIPFERCGKVIVAVEQAELEGLGRLLERGRANGVQAELVGPERLRELEPQVVGLQALHVPETGIVDYRLVCAKLWERVAGRGGELRLGAPVGALRPTAGGMLVVSPEREAEARLVVNCAGLQVDRVAALGGVPPALRIVPFRGEYYALRPAARHLVRNLIYPVPDPRFPFLGVHFTRRIDGSVECGPNAVLAFAREGYRKGDVSLRDLWDTVSYPGFRRLAARHWRMGASEMWRSLSKEAFTRALQRLVPAVEQRDLEPAPAGVRAQALARDGRLVDDFTILEGERVVHVLNAPSPAATSCLSIGELVVEKLAARLG